MAQRGKSHNAIMVACARKLLIFANAVAARGTPWENAPESARQNAKPASA
jgi:transposase